MTIFALAAVSVVSIRTIASPTSLVATITELSAIVKFSFHIPSINVLVSLQVRRDKHLSQVRLLHFLQAHRSLNPTFTWPFVSLASKSP